MFKYINLKFKSSYNIYSNEDEKNDNYKPLYNEEDNNEDEDDNLLKSPDDNLLSSNHKNPDTYSVDDNDHNDIKQNNIDNNLLNNKINNTLEKKSDQKNSNKSKSSKKLNHRKQNVKRVMTNSFYLLMIIFVISLLSYESYSFFNKKKINIEQKTTKIIENKHLNKYYLWKVKKNEVINLAGHSGSISEHLEFYISQNYISQESLFETFQYKKDNIKRDLANKIRDMDYSQGMEVKLPFSNTNNDRFLSSAFIFFSIVDYAFFDDNKLKNETKIKQIVMDSFLKNNQNISLSTEITEDDEKDLEKFISNKLQQIISDLDKFLFQDAKNFSKLCRTPNSIYNLFNEILEKTNENFFDQISGDHYVLKELNFIFEKKIKILEPKTTT